MKIGPYTLVNDDKVRRAIDGTPGKAGQSNGGVGEERDPKTKKLLNGEAIIAEYDKLGGLILKDSRKIKTGCFYNFETSAPIAKPKVIFVFSVDGEKVELEEGKDIPLEVQAAEKKAKTTATKAAKGKTVKDEDTSDAEESEEAAEATDAVDEDEE